MNHPSYHEVDEMVHQLDMQTKKRHRQQQSPDELMKELEFATRKKRKSLKAPGARDYVYSGGIKINKPSSTRKKYVCSSEGKDHSSATSTLPEATGKLVNLLICYVEVMHNKTVYIYN